ncbi:MAG: hypothetical protein M3133_10690 [Actinomycetota bacterium]|nr:hypothetical protein [Actinomycetota bacterium]
MTMDASERVIEPSDRPVSDGQSLPRKKVATALVAPRAVPAATGEHHDDSHEDQDEHDYAQQHHPARSGVGLERGRRVRHVRFSFRA